jgi:hypothetical protein
MIFYSFLTLSKQQNKSLPENGAVDKQNTEKQNKITNIKKQLKSIEFLSHV